MNYKKLIGYKLDTNQFTTSIIETEEQAILAVDKIIRIYSVDILNYMFLTTDGRYSTFGKDGVTLKSLLYSN